MSSVVRGFASLSFPLAVILACSAAPTETSREPVTMVVVNPENATIQAGGTVALKAYALDTAGRPNDDRRIFWASSNESVATVSSSGVVRGHAPGTTQIAASSEGKSAIARVTVTPRPVASVTVTPATAQLDLGATVNLRAVTRDASGSELSGRSVSWSSSASSVATVNASGLVTAVGPGTATITARSEGRSGTAVVQVRSSPVRRVSVSSPASELRVGETMQLVARTYDSSDRELKGRSIAWSSSNSSIATVDASGRVTGRSAGSVRITATSEGRSGDVSLKVLALASSAPGAVDRVVIEPSSVTLSARRRETAQLRVRAYDAEGREVSVTKVSWQTSDKKVATVSSSGRVKAVSPGSAVITAKVSGKSGEASVTVNNSK